MIPVPTQLRIYSWVTSSCSQLTVMWSLIYSTLRIVIGSSVQSDLQPFPRLPARPSSYPPAALSPCCVVSLSPHRVVASLPVTIIDIAPLLSLAVVAVLLPYPVVLPPRQHCCLVVRCLVSATTLQHCCFVGVATSLRRRLVSSAASLCRRTVALSLNVLTTILQQGCNVAASSRILFSSHRRWRRQRARNGE
ncbi:hypothetical protein BD779DRAFT_1535830 [Infundibulicybe gibba]|nr:hypothetical protein BD779DRAFT_1535830 [Infundibulicybe gibba]